MDSERVHIPNPAGLRDTEAQLRLALQAAKIGIWEFHVSSGALIWDARVREVVEADPEIVPTWEAHFLPAIHPQDRDRVQAAFARAFAMPDEGLAVEFRVIGARTGRVTWAALIGRLDEGPTGARLMGTARDITAEREGLQLIRAKSQDLESRISEVLAERRVWANIVEASDDPVVAVDTGLTFIALNPAYVDACQKLFGRRFRIGDRLTDVLSHMPEARDAAVMLWKRALSGRRFELQTREADPAGKVYDNQFGPLRDAGGAIVGAFQTSRDVTARVAAEASLKQTSAALQQAQKMEAIGNLTGGIAHDFNNLLQVISGNLQLLGRDVIGNARAERRVANAMEGVSRGAKLAAQLLAFGRRQALDPVVTNVGRLLPGMDDLLRRTLGEEIEIETFVAEDLWNTLVDPSQVENAILNLAINARDAMQGAGRLTIEAANAELDDDYARENPDVTAGAHILVAVTDTGAGMVADLIEKVFEPFFSTKPEGHGTGLGLSMVHGFVKQSGGHVKIYSEVGHGTTVKIYLPRSDAPETRRAETPAAAAPQGSASVLVVEDDAAVRETAVTLLRDLGYRVTEASHAAEALEIVEDGAEVDLIFTDVVMPGAVRSVDMVRRAQEIRPGVAVLFTSGFTRNAIVHGGRLDPGVDLLTKPYSREVLARRIAEVLARR